MVACLSALEREVIFEGVLAGDGVRTIARRLGRAASTVSRELQRNALTPRPGHRSRAGTAPRYSGVQAQWTATARRCRPRPRRLVSDRVLRGQVLAGLGRGWSPQQIAADLTRRFPQDRGMRISHEAIYQAIYLQGRGSLRAELTYQQALRTGRTRRRHQSRIATNKPWVDLNIAARPAEVADRAVPGHWEGDLLIGAANASAVATLVERATRFLLLVALPGGKVSEHVAAQLTAAMTRLPAHLRRTLTWDQGSELAAHARFSLATGCEVYFCDPHSPWQRGTNENTNGLLRQYLPRGLDLTTRTQTDLDHIADLLNTRPRQTLNWDTPAQRLNQLLLQ